MARTGTFMTPPARFMVDLSSIRPENNSTIPYDNRTADQVAASNPNPPSVANGGVPVPVPLPYSPTLNQQAAQQLAQTQAQQAV